MQTDVFILGAGAGGIGSTYRLVKNGVNVCVCDKNEYFGGTMVYGGVCCWEPGVSLNGIHEILAKKMSEYGAGPAKTVPNGALFYPDSADNWEYQDFRKYPWGLSVMDRNSDYTDTLRRYGYGQAYSDHNTKMRRFQFDEEYMIKAVREVFAPYSDKLTAYFGKTIKRANIKGNKIQSVVLNNGTEITAKYYIDAAGGIPLAVMCGCGSAFGSESKSVYNEPSANDTGNDLNGVTYVFRVTKTDDPGHTDKIPDEYYSSDIASEGIISCFNTYPNGDININMLPTMGGREYFELGENADIEARKKVWNYWHYLQENKGLKGYKLIKIFDAGIREDRRLVGKYVLTENDIRKGLKNITADDHIIAVADHAMDIHGKNGMINELSEPYGIPIECAMTKEIDNLFVCGKSASFSHLAASSARLSRTMLSFGEGVGEYLAMMIQDNNADSPGFMLFRD